VGTICKSGQQNLLVKNSKKLNMQHVVIIGNGIAGTTAARHIRKLSNFKITIISNEAKYFFSRTALMYVYMGHMKFEHTQPYENNFWAENNINLLEAEVLGIDTDNKILKLKDGSDFNYDSLIIATGSKSNKFGWPGQDLIGATGLYHKQDLDNIEKLSANCKRAVVVGGGLIGIELAEMLLARNIAVTFLVREKSFWDLVLPAGESKMINEHILEHGIDLKLETGLKEIISDENGRAKAVVTDKDETIACEIVGLTAGVSPNVDFLKNQNIEIGRGVKVNRFLQTNIPNIYAIGDCAEQHEAIGNRRPIEAVWYTGRMMGETVAQTICGNPMEYKPGHWFNSAKFLDIEYQTYGWVFAQPKENEAHFFWQHPTENKCVTLALDKQTKAFVGINVFGIRMRHQFFDDVLTKNETAQFVIDNWAAANFDPEFFTAYHKDISSSFQTFLKTLSN
jgi:NADPH-dependent 2,4-dienoyl-CoA reductase/sulfur reductase-like enzyme